MNEHTIVQTIDIAAPPEQVWAFISRPENLRQWWQADTLEITLEPQGDYREEGTFHGMPYRYVGTVMAVEPPHKLVFTLRVEQPVEWPPDVFTTVTLTLHAHAEHTTVTLEHSGFDRLPVEFRGMIKGFAPGWAAVLPRLAELVTPSPA